MQVHVQPPRVTAVPGTATTVSVIVVNDTDVARHVQLRVVGLEPGWVEHTAADLTIPAQSELEAPIRITLPHGFPRGDQLVGIEVQPDGGGRALVTELTLGVSDLEGLSIGLSPVTARGGWRGRFKLNIENRSNQPLTIKLSGRGAGPDDAKSDVEFKFTPPVLTLRPGERVKTRAWVSGRRAVWGKGVRRPFTVTAQGETAPRHVQGAFVQRPMLPHNILRVVGLVVVLAMWAGGVLVAVNVTSSKGKISTQEAASEQPGAAGANGSGGASGSDGATGTGSTETAKPTTGAAIAGQVKGAQDPSGVLVSLQPVALADNISQNATLISAKGDSGGKEWAQFRIESSSGPVGSLTSTTTDADGRWAFGGLKSPANYQLTFSKAGFAERSYIISVDQDNASIALDVDMKPGNGALSGTIKGPDGPLGGVSVTVTDGKVTFHTTTPTSGDDIGKWSLNGLTTPGTYLVTADQRGYGTESTSIDLGSGDQRSGIDLTLVPGVGSIGGLVRGSGTPAGNITVTATDGKVTRTATTLTEAPIGRYSLPQLPIPGTYTVTVAGAGWITQTVSIKLTGNRNDLNIDLVPTTATIVGTVRDSGGAALPSSGVTLAQDKPIVKTLTAIDPAGTYELTGLAPGTYVLTFDRADFKTQSASVTVAAGERKTVDAALVSQPATDVPKDASVGGIVRDSTTSAAVSGVSVTLNGSSVTTDTNGSFTFPTVAPGSYDIKFDNSSYQHAEQTVRVAAKSTTTLDVVILPLGGVQGQVTDLTATAIAGVSVSIVNDPAATDQDPFSTTATSSSAGQYSILRQIPTGKYIITFSKSGYETRTRSVEVAAGTTQSVDNTLIELGSIHGTVQEPASGSTGGFSPLASASVVLGTPGSGSTCVGSLQTITTDSLGEYFIHGLSPGDYCVTVSKSGYQTFIKTMTGIALRETRDGGVILTPNPQTISGQLTYVDSLSVHQPIVGASVSVNAITGYDTLTIFPYIRSHSTTLTATTDASGNWSITGPVAGSASTYTFTATGFTTGTLSLTPPVSSGGADKTLVASPRNVAGTIALNPAASGTLTSVSVSVTGAGSATTTVDSSGNFRFTNLPVGSYFLTASLAGFKSTTQVLTVPPGNPAVDVAAGTVTVNKFSSITPTVKNGSGTALSGVSVTLNGGSAVTTGAGGTTTFSSLDPGTYTLVFSKTGFSTVTTSITITAGVDATAATDPATLNISLLTLPTIAVTVRSVIDTTNFTALTGATVTAQLLTGGVPGGTVLTSTRTSNTYTITVPAAGSYRVTISSPNTATQTADYSVILGDALTPAIDLLGWTTISVHAQRHFGTTTNDLTGSASSITAVISGGGPTINFSEGAGGVYTSTAVVAPGTYTITAGPNGYVNNTTTITAVAGTTPTQASVTVEQLPRITITVNSSLDSGSGAVLSAFNTATVTVSVHGGSAVTVTHTGGTNVYVADGLAVGAYDISVSGSAADPQAFTSVSVIAGQDYTQTVNLLAWPTISVHAQRHFGASTNDLTGAASSVTAVRTLDALGGSVSGQPTITFTESAGGIYTSSAAVNPGTYTITAAPSGYVSNTTTIVPAAGTVPARATLTVEQLPRISITVNSSLDSGSGAVLSALNTATVTVTPHGGGAAQTVNRTNNVYVADSLAVGSYDISVSGSAQDAQTFTSVSVIAGQDYTQTVNLLAWPNISLHLQGTFNSTTGDITGAASSVTAVRTLDALGGSVSGQPTITFTGGTLGVYTSSAVVTPGTYTITATPTGYDTTGNTVDVVAVAGTVPAAGAITLNQLPALAITVNGSLDGTPTALTSATVRVTKLTSCGGTSVGGNSPISPSTTSSNVYTFNNLPAACYQLDVSNGTNYISQSLDGASQVDLHVAGSSTSRTVTLLEQPVLTVTVTGQAGSSAPFNGTSPLTSATVTATRTAGPGSTFTLTSQGNGTYTGHAESGTTYTLKASATGYGATSGALTTIATGVAPTDGTTTSNSVALVNTPGTISGTVRDSISGLPLSGVTVSAQSGGTVLSSQTTSGAGTYSFTSVVPATWSLTYTKTTYSSLTQSVLVTANATSTADAVLVQLGATISGKTLGQATSTSNVSSSTDNPTSALDNVTVAISASGFTTQTQTVQDDGSGNFTYGFSNIPAGTYTITFTHNNYVTRSRSLTVSAAQVLSLTDTLVAHTGTVNVNVKDLETGASPLLVNGAQVRLAGVLLGSSNPTTVTSATVATVDGVATFPNVPPGTYTASLFSPPSGYLSSATTYPITLPLSAGGADATVLAGTGSVSQDLSIQKAVSLKVTVAGLVNGDTASVAVTWAGGGSATPQTTGNGNVTFTGLPPSTAFTIQGTATHYTGGAGSSVGATLGAQATATITMVPDKATVDVTVTGLINGDTTDVTLDGNTVTGIGVGGTAHFVSNVTPGSVLPVTYSNSNYTGTLNTPSLTAGGTYTGGSALTLALTPKNGSVTVTIAGLLYSEQATVTLNDNTASTSSQQTVSNGLVTFSNKTPGHSYTLSVTATNYDVPAITGATFTLNANETHALGTVTVTRQTGTVDVTTAGLTTETGTITATWSTGGTTSHSFTGNAVTSLTIPSGITVTVSVSAVAGKTTPGSQTTNVASGGTNVLTFTYT